MLQVAAVSLESSLTWYLLHFQFDAGNRAGRVFIAQEFSWAFLWNLPL
jgi:hypothetical protein